MLQYHLPPNYMALGLTQSNDTQQRSEKDPGFLKKPNPLGFSDFFIRTSS